MKILIAIGIVQFGLLLFLVGKIGVLERDLNNVEPQQPTIEPMERSTDAFARADTALNETQLREIIREELAAQLATWSGAVAGSNLPNSVDYRTNPADQAKSQERFESVKQQLNFYESVGRISDYEMQELQSEIVKLNATDRKEAFRLLMRAMSSGALKGQL